MCFLNTPDRIRPSVGIAAPYLGSKFSYIEVVSARGFLYWIWDFLKVFHFGISRAIFRNFSFTNGPTIPIFP